MSTGAVAVIPARGGSKRIPRKNMRPFEGKPILAYSIETALRSELFDEVMVSTDDEEISVLARCLGAAVPFPRSAQNSNDYAGTAEVLIEVLNEYERRQRVFGYGCCIYPTAPFITAELLQRTFQMMVTEEYDSVFPILRFSYPIQRALKSENGKINMIWPENYSARSQDLLPAYHDAGQFYWFEVQALKQKKRLWTDRSGALEISELDAHDIDSLEDWSVAEFKYRFRAHARSV